MTGDDACRLLALVRNGQIADFLAEAEELGAADLADVDRQRLDFLAARQLDHATLAGVAVQAAIEAVVLADKVGDKGVLRFFVKGARCGDLLHRGRWRRAGRWGHPARLHRPGAHGVVGRQAQIQ